MLFVAPRAIVVERANWEAGIGPPPAGGGTERRPVGPARCQSPSGPPSPSGEVEPKFEELCSAEENSAAAQRRKRDATEERQHEAVSHLLRFVTRSPAAAAPRMRLCLSSTRART